MRLRYVKGSVEAVEASEYVVHDPPGLKGKWSALYEGGAPIHLEIGMGKGRFIREMALRSPEINYLGIERYESVLIKALKRQEEEELPNLFFLCEDAALITTFFDREEIERIYLNFSDPWPKARHAKRRLVSREYLRRYDEILTPGGRVEFKTDNRVLFDYALEEVPAAGWQIEALTYDLHADPVMNEGNIMTEYEERFSGMGNPICKYIIYR